MSAIKDLRCKVAVLQWFHLRPTRPSVDRFTFRQERILYWNQCYPLIMTKVHNPSGLQELEVTTRASLSVSTSMCFNDGHISKIRTLDKYVILWKNIVQTLIILSPCPFLQFCTYLVFRNLKEDKTGMSHSSPSSSTCCTGTAQADWNGIKTFGQRNLSRTELLEISSVQEWKTGLESKSICE